MEWLNEACADIVCLQEIKANKEQLTDDLINPKGYYSYFNSADKKGYSGVLVYTKIKPLKVEYKLGIERFDSEGRIIILHYPEFILYNLYIPHGGRKKENLAYKLEVYKHLFEILNKEKNKNIILAGDFNIAHNEIDLARPKNNKKNIMFTPEERTQLDKLINLDFVDTFRHFNKLEQKFTWWPYMANLRERNIGWRIDYVFVSNNMLENVKESFILRRNTVWSERPTDG